ncbi:SDR family oxidoreductase [Actinoplanes sp. NPDC051411]|uniref:SDR family oxidoreductase n=1 Tax=Actinoplanes sp. NPDC051411 TaxID=3155522 RepID=UPI0034409C5B
MTAKSVVVVGGSRGLGLGVANAARDAGARVTSISRAEGDATDEAFADKVLASEHPDLLVITAGAVPAMGPLTSQTWESFSTNWNADVRIAFVWLRAALRLPLAPDARVVVFGSGAELRGSPLSGGYAGAKAAVRLITGYAGGLGLQTTTVLPLITPGTAVGETAIEAYGVSAGVGPEEFRAGLTSYASPEFAGQTIVALADAPSLSPVYLLDASGLHPLDR